MLKNLLFLGLDIYMKTWKSLWLYLYVFDFQIIVNRFSIMNYKNIKCDMNKANILHI